MITKIESYTTNKYLIEARDLYPTLKTYRIFNNVFIGFRENDKYHLYDRISRLQKKYPEKDLKYFNKLLRKGLDEITKRLKDNITENSVIFNYMIISNKSNLKFPIEVEIIRDRKNNIKEINAIITTMLDKEEHLINTKNEEEVYINESFIRLQEFNSVGNYSYSVDLEKGKKYKYFSEIEID